METQIENFKLQIAKWKNSKEKGVSKMKKLIGLGIGALMVLSLGQVAFAGTAEVDVYVTPGAISTTLTALTTYYYFGTVDLSVSSNSATAITLDNDGNVDVTLTKTIADKDAGGTVVLVNDSPTAINEFRLRCVEKESKATLETDFANADCDFSTAEGTPNNLVDTTDTQSDLAADGQAGETCDIWFQIDMPPQVDTSAERKFDLTFTSTAK